MPRIFFFLFSFVFFIFDLFAKKKPNSVNFVVYWRRKTPIGVRILSTFGERLPVILGDTASDLA